MLSRGGASLVELLVALALGALVLGAAAGSLLRQQRASAWVGAVAAGGAQMRPAGQLVRADLAFLDPRSGDLAPGEASDTAVQTRAVVGVSIACDSSAGQVTLMPIDSARVPLTGLAEAPRAGDSVWWYAGDSSGWRPRAVTAVVPATVLCRSPAGTGRSYRLALSGADTVPGAAPLRLTRQLRFGIYRAADRHWYLGVREGSSAFGALAPPQPVAGPFLRAHAGAPTTGFRYYDATGAELTAPASDGAPIARIRVTSVVSARTSLAPGGVRYDSVDVAPRGRRAP